VATPVLTAKLWAVSHWKPVKAPDQEVTNMTDDQKKELAESYIAKSRRDELHTCDSPESSCAGCEMMRKGLRMLAEIGDPTVYRV
jgi:hypothetical protein